MTSKLIDQAMSFDPVQEAENMGVQGDAIAGVAFSFLQDRRAVLDRLLQSSGDVCSRTSYDDYCAIAQSLGFELAYAETFEGSSEQKPDTEHFRVFFQPEYGFLLVLESYAYSLGGEYGGRVNNAKLYYNFAIPESARDKFWECISSGGWHETDLDGIKVFAGDHDVRDGLKHTMNKLLSSGAIPLKKWHTKPHLWLVNYSETQNDGLEWYVRSEEWKKSMAAKIEKFPVTLREMLKNARR